MGTDLLIISNHAVDFAEFDFDRLGREIATRLNQTRLANPEYFWLSRLWWKKGRSGPIRPDTTALLQPWRLSNDDNRRAEFYDQGNWAHGQLHFSGPFEWEITVSPGKADINLLPFRYRGWAGPSKTEPDRPRRTAYRKALATLVRALGGSEVTYLADNSHPLSQFWEIDDYATVRQELRAQLGPPLTSLAQMEAWQDELWNGDTRQYRRDCAYLVDDFSDLNWAQPITLPPELQQLRASSNLAMPASLPLGL